MDLLSTFSDDEEDDDDIIYCNFSDEDDDDDLLELEILQRIRKNKWVHQCLNWLALVKKLEHDTCLHKLIKCHFKHSCPLLTCYTSTFHMII